ncbi:hypothetical protein BDB00DRAFT_786355 [Zychaea mexicana]|uniref:uncharacterized protein n=1 Tax=Zychaea mexicana TaxID=64656 RepID=UPI0022FF1579|nr:uncharacterized protein BDB00DRAFT_786355 [Zychaea mexicana]KAI9495563.1 hypothetical protein BDB00DRAFT_786355 [Zychaea mexicana]
MEEIAKDHISWFEQHDTAEKLLEAKKPYHFSNIKRADNGRNTNNDTKRTQSLTDRRRGSSSSDGSMRTASEMNDVDNQDTDRVHLVQASRHHITTAANNNNNMRMSSSFHRNSVTTTASKESNGESDSDGMDSDLCPTNIPEWATSPELMEKLKFQKPTDGDKVFGEMVPMEISVIFGNTVKSKP